MLRSSYFLCSKKYKATHSFLNILQCKKIQKQKDQLEVQVRDNGNLDQGVKYSEEIVIQDIFLSWR